MEKEKVENLKNLYKHIKKTNRQKNIIFIII